MLGVPGNGAEMQHIDLHSPTKRSEYENKSGNTGTYRDDL